jgi:hypothetical protein
MSEVTPPATHSAGLDRAGERLMAARRRRVITNVLLFVGVTAGMTLVVMARRDAQTVERCHQTLAHALEKISAARDAGQPLPLILPLPQEGTYIAREHYYYNPLTTGLLGRTPAVGLACCDRPHTRFLGANGRNVVFYDGTRFELRWVDEKEFRGQARTWGLRVFLDK